MELTNMSRVTKKKSVLKLKVECDSRRRATNIRACITELLVVDMNLSRKDIQFKVEVKDGKK